MASVYSVGQVNAYIKNMFNADFALNNIYIKGEISNCKYHTSGHIYFTLKDSTGVISAVMFAGNRKGLKFKLEEGQKVIALGSVSVYERDGKYQLYAKQIILEGTGLLYQRFEQLKTQLEEMGLFDKMYKKPIPKYATKVGICTASTGAAIQDIINISKRRNPFVQLYLYPCLVQGQGAAVDIVNAIRCLDSMDLDVIIVGRGGGSIEDLWAFNEEIVARAIYEAHTPIISAVGHETDFTIADFVADRRAETPTAAAEMAVPNMTELMQKLERCRNSLRADLQQKISYAGLQADKLFAELQHVLQRRLLAYRHELESCRLILEENHPYRILRKGYAVLEDAAGQNLSSAGDLRDGQIYKLKLKDGSAVFRMTELAVTKEDINDDL